MSEVRRSQMLTSSGIARTLQMAAQNGLITGNRESKRTSVNQFYSMAAEQDTDVDDELSNAQRHLSDLKTKISLQSKRNFVLERDVRYLDSRIALLIQNRMNAHEQQEVASHLEENEHMDGSFPDEKKRNLYGNLFFILQSEPRYIAHLCRLVTLAEIDVLLQTVMFTLYGNQYESREEHLLLTMFQGVLSSQFESATDYNGLMRANTPVSRMMTTYTRRGPGQQYLKNVLSSKINEIIEVRDLDLEINPLKVYEAYRKQKEEELGDACELPKSITPDQAADYPQIAAIIAPRCAKLIEIANSFVDIIIASKEQVPYGIRWICKQIRSLTKRKYPDATDYSICTLIGGFFFLRFVNPSVVTPQAYMLVDGTPQANPRRTLTLIAKMMQNLANKPTYAKEAYMFALNAFVEDNKARINKFLNELCETSDFHERLELDQYMALSRKEIKLSITLNEIYNTHALLVQHLDELSPEQDSHLRELLRDLGPAPPQVPRSENKTIELPLFSKFETPLDLTIASLADNTVTQSDLLFMETKSIYVHIVRSIPGLTRSGGRGRGMTLKEGVSLLKIADMAATSKDGTLVKKGIKVKDIMRELEELKVIHKEDHYKVLLDEIKEELVHLGNLRDKLAMETESLQAVYKTIGDHNDYLKSQLESYKAYLQNVRSQASAALGGRKDKLLGPYKFSHQQFEKEGIVVESNVPEARQPNIFFTLSSPSPGTFIIALHYKGRDKAILEMDLKLDDLLEKQQDNVQTLDLEYVQLSVTKLLTLLNKTFSKR